jgi:hypothetical protein
MAMRESRGHITSMAVTDRLWERADLVAIVEAAGARPAKIRGPYKKKSIA